MRCKILLAFCCLSWVTLSSAQAITTESDTTIYSLKVPKKWNDPKFLYQLTGFIAKNIPLLRDKKVCVDCSHSIYEVSLIVVAPKLLSQSVTNVTKAYETKTERYEYAISYSFMASLNFTEKFTNRNQKIILVDSAENYGKSRVFDDNSKASRKPDLSNSPQPVATRNNFARTASIGVPAYSTVPPPDHTPTVTYAGNPDTIFDPEKFKQEHERAVKPDDNELRTIVQNRVTVLNASATVKK